MTNFIIIMFAMLIVTVGWIWFGPNETPLGLKRTLRVITKYQFPDGTVISAAYDMLTKIYYVSIPENSNFDYSDYMWFPKGDTDTYNILYIYGSYIDDNNDAKSITISIPVVENIYRPTIVFTDDLSDYLTQMYSHDKCITLTVKHEHKV